MHLLSLQVPAAALQLLMRGGTEDGKSDQSLGTIQEEINTEEEGDEGKYHLVLSM